jgi:histidine triad (HIT) family protein
MAYDDSNVFAKILRGELPYHKVYEDEHTLALMDIMPQAEGHTLVIPKAPSRNLLDANPKALERVLPVVQRIARAVKRAFAADGVTVFQYNEAASGQTVFHLHFHVVPRFDRVPLKPHSGTMAPPDALSAGAEKIKRALQSL